MLSFVVTAYNAEATVAETLESILAQDLGSPHEVVVVDDASTDATADVVRAFCARAPDVVSLVSHERNRGNGAARNRGVREAEGDLIRIVDSDNVLAPGTVQAELDLVAGSQLHAASVEKLRFFETDTADVTHEWTLTAAGGVSGVDELLVSTRVPAAHGNYLFTRRLWEAVGGYEEGLAAIESWSFGVKHCVRGFAVGIAEGAVYFHRVGHASYWIREARAGTNDVNALAILRQESSRLPGDVAEKVGRLRPGDPVLEYIDAGRFAPGAAIPPAARRRAQRTRRRLERRAAELDLVPRLARSPAGPALKRVRDAVAHRP